MVFLRLDHADTRHVLSQLGLELIPENFFKLKEIQLYDIDGSIITRDLFENAQAFLNDILIEVRENFLKKDNFKEIECPTAFDLLEQAIKDHKLYPHFHNCHLRIIYWHLTALRFRNAIHSENIIKKAGPENFYSVAGGLGQMTHGLAYGTNQENNYSLDIHCGRMIEEVNINDSGKVEIVCGESKFEGDYAVCDLKNPYLLSRFWLFPSLIIRRYYIESNLNPLKNSIENSEELINHQLVNKICVVFPRVFWPIATEYFGILYDHSSQSKGKYFLIQNMFHETKLPCLMIYCCGKGALELETHDDLTIQKDVLNILARMFPLECPLPYPIESIITRWSSDRYNLNLNAKAKEMKTNVPKDNCKLVWTENRPSFINSKIGGKIFNKFDFLEAIKNGKNAARIIADKILGVVS